MPDLSHMAAEESVVIAGKKEKVEDSEDNKERGGGRSGRGLSSKANGVVQSKTKKDLERGREKLKEFREKKNRSRTLPSGAQDTATSRKEVIAGEKPVVTGVGASGVVLPAEHVSTNGLKETVGTGSVGGGPSADGYNKDKVVLANGHVSELGWAGSKSSTIVVGELGAVRSKEDSVENGSAAGPWRSKSSSQAGPVVVERPAILQQEHDRDHLGPHSASDAQQTAGMVGETSALSSSARGSGLSFAVSGGMGASAVQTAALPVAGSATNAVDNGLRVMKPSSSRGPPSALETKSDMSRFSVPSSLSAAPSSGQASSSQPLAVVAEERYVGSSRAASTAEGTASPARVQPFLSSKIGASSSTAGPILAPVLKEQRLDQEWPSGVATSSAALNELLASGAVISSAHNRLDFGLSSSSAVASKAASLERLSKSSVPYNSLSSVSADVVSAVSNVPSLPWRQEDGHCKAVAAMPSSVKMMGVGSEVSGVGELRVSDEGHPVTSLGKLETCQNEDGSSETKPAEGQLSGRDNAMSTLTSGGKVSAQAVAGLRDGWSKEQTTLFLGQEKSAMAEEPAFRQSPPRDAILRTRVSSLPSLNSVLGAGVEPRKALSTDRLEYPNKPDTLDSVQVSSLPSGPSPFFFSRPYLSGPGRTPTSFSSTQLSLSQPASTSSLFMSSSSDLARKPWTGSPFAQPRTGPSFAPLSSSPVTVGARSNMLTSSYTTLTRASLPVSRSDPQPAVPSSTTLFLSRPPLSSDAAHQPITPPSYALSLLPTVLVSSTSSSLSPSGAFVALSPPAAQQSELAGDGTDTARDAGGGGGGGAVQARPRPETGVTEDAQVQHSMDDSSWKPSLKPSISNDFSALEQHIEDLTQEKFALQRAVDAARILSESLAKENTQLTDDFNSQGAVVNQLREELNWQREELRSQQAVLSSLRAEKEKVVQESGAAAARAKAMASEVITLEDKVRRVRSNELKLEHELERVTTELETLRRQNASAAADRTNLQSMINAQQEEKKVLLAKLKKLEAVAQQPAADVRKTADASTSTDDLEIPSEAGASTVDSPVGSPAVLSPVEIPAAAETKSAVDWLSPRADEGLMTMGSGTVLPVAKSVIPTEELALIESINTLLTQLESEKNNLVQLLEKEMKAAAKLRAANQDLSRKLAAQTQRLELAVSQNMMRGNVDAANQRADAEVDQGLDEGDEVVERVLDWIMTLFPRNRANRREPAKLN